MVISTLKWTWPNYVYAWNRYMLVAYWGVHRAGQWSWVGFDVFSQWDPRLGGGPSSGPELILTGWKERGALICLVLSLAGQSRLPNNPAELALQSRAALFKSSPGAEWILTGCIAVESEFCWNWEFCRVMVAALARWPGGVRRVGRHSSAL